MTDTVCLPLTAKAALRRAGSLGLLSWAVRRKAQSRIVQWIEGGSTKISKGLGDATGQPMAGLLL